MQTQIPIGVRIAAGLLLLAGRVLCLAPEAVAWWSFDADEAKALDRIGHIQDVVKGRFQYGPGIAGNSLQFDGFTTMIVREAGSAPALNHGLAIEAWIAPQEYSWNWTAIVNQGSDLKTGYFFGIDYTGRIGLSVAINGTWQTLVTREKVPLLKWSHVVGSFDPEVGLAIYINGQSAGRLDIKGTVDRSNAEVWVGASQMLMGVANTEREPSRRALEHTRMVFDGLIDEVKVYDGPLGAAEAALLFSAVQVPEEPPLRYRVLPSGSKQVRKFGAFYEQLQYSNGWDALWRGSGPDVVVAFDFAPIRLVSWRGVSYAPSWVTENGNWFSNECMERAVPDGCAESMSDKQARYSSVKILESNDARAVLYWRYSPVDINHQVPFPDPVTGWGDWAEEYYTVYPDGVAVRKFVGWTSVPRHASFLEWSQSLPILQPGQRPEDVLDSDSFVTLANMHGESQTYRWPPEQPVITVPSANIQVVNYKAEYKPFVILTDRNPRITLPKSMRREPGQEIRGMSMPEDSKLVVESLAGSTATKRRQGGAGGGPSLS